MIHLKYGYDFKTDIIGKWKSKANTAIAAGKVVDRDSNGEIVAATALGYFLIQDVTIDGPSFNERELGVFQWDVKAGDPVAVVPPIRGAIIWTDNMTGTVAVGDEVEVATGGALQKQSGGTAIGKVLSIPSTGVYEIKLY